MIIKLLLIAALAAAAFTLMHGRRSALSLLVRRGIALLAIALGVVAVVFPDLVTYVAHAVGVGRGTDLVVYALCVTFLFTTIGLHMRLAALNDRFVDLARRVALNEAKDEAARAQTALAETQRSNVA
jgi:hypothetical protein